VKLFDDKLDQLRRNLTREVDILGEKMLNWLRGLLLRNAQNLNDARRECEWLEEALHFNELLTQAYYLKEEFRLFWDQADKRAAVRFLLTWMQWAQNSGIGVMIQLARTIGLFQLFLLGWYDHSTSMAVLEVANNKIKTIKPQDYGFPSREFFKLKILALHDGHYELVG
jgi:transposase